MAFSAIKFATVDELQLDPLNPRLGRSHTGATVKQSTVLNLMRDWSLDELAISFLESGFWPHEALLVVEEPLYGKKALVVVEGNRRLAALKYLKLAIDGHSKEKKWREITHAKPANDLFSKVPYIKIDSRKDVSAFLGFRHVTGIKEWRPAEKAEYIARLIEEEGLSYRDVMRKIGSKTPAVRQNYISYKLLLQMEDREDISVAYVEDRFSVLFLSLRTEGVQKYLHIDIAAEPAQAKSPVPKSHLRNLEKFALWLFGTEKTQPMVQDSRQVDQFGKILESAKAVAYLERTDHPNFQTAHRLAGGDEPEVERLISQAADNIEAALSRAHMHAKSKKVRAATRRLGEDAKQLISLFTGLEEELEGDR